MMDEYTTQATPCFRQAEDRQNNRTLRRSQCFSNMISQVNSGWSVGVGFMILLFILHIADVYFFIKYHIT